MTTGDGETGVSRRRSRGDSGEKEGKEVKDLSEAAMEEAELEGWEVILPLLLVARTSVDLCELLDRRECCETERSCWRGDVSPGADSSVSIAAVDGGVVDDAAGAFSLLCCAAQV